MTTDLDVRAADVFLRAVDLAPGDRTRVIEGACGRDDALRARVRSLLEADAKLSRDRRPEEDPLSGLVGSRVGSYRIVRLLGSGGMGAVYEAEQDNPRRSVALKLMRPDAVGAGALRRFEYESQVLARLQHPGIAQVYEAGTHALPGAGRGSAGVPFFAMEFVEGARSIAEFCTAEALDVRARVELFARVCDAVHHGHQKGVIHRDLKPGNILIDAAGNPKIIDFGVARATDSEVTAATIETGVGQIIGTLRYMSPDQCEGDSQGIDTRSDVYSLGVILYELLTGLAPYDLTGRPLYEAARIIREAHPRRPSAVIRSLRGDLETIVLKALEKERERRYASAAELAADLRRFLRREPITARPPSAVYQLRLFARRNRGLVTGVVGAFAALAIGLAVAVRQTGRTRAALDESQRQAYAANIAAADGALRGDDGGMAMDRLRAAPEALRGWEWRHLMARADRSVRTMAFPDRPLTTGSLSPDGTSLVLSQKPRTLSLIEFASGRPRWTKDGVLGCLRPFSPDGAWIACFGGRELVILDAASGTEAARFEVDTDVESTLSVGFHPDGRRIATSNKSGHVILWDWRRGVREQELVSGTWIMTVQFSRDGALLAYATPGVVHLLSTDTWEQVRDLSITTEYAYENARAIAFSPDGALIAAAHGPVVRVWRTDSGEPVGPGPIVTHTQRVIDLAFSPDGTLIASAGADRTLRLWDLRESRPRDTLVGHAGVVCSVGFRKGGSEMVTTSEDRTARVWEVPRLDASEIATPDGIPLSLSYFHGGERAFCSAGGAATIMDVSTHHILATIPEAAHPGYACYSLSPDGRSIAMWDESDALCLTDAATGERRWRVEGECRKTVELLAFSPDGRRLVTLSPAEDTRLWNTESGALMGRVLPGVPCREARFRPGTELLALCATRGPVRLWDLTRGELPPAIADPGGRALTLAFNADGSLLAIGTAEGVVGVWDTVSWRRIAGLTGMQPEVWSVAFSPDGSRLAVGSKDRMIHIWDTRSWRDLLQLRGHVGTVVSLAWSQDQSVLMSGSYDRTLRFWTAPPPDAVGWSGKPLGAPGAR